MVDLHPLLENALLTEVPENRDLLYAAAVALYELKR